VVLDPLDFGLDFVDFSDLIGFLGGMILAVKTILKYI
jgi:hypothetical protein